VAVALVDTLVVVTVKVADVAPAGTVTEVGTFADALLLESETAMPPDDAAALSATVPVADVPPVTLVGLIATEFRLAADVVGALTVTPALLVVPL
jgi:hypothetical protein